MSYYYEAGGVTATWGVITVSTGFKTLSVTPNSARVTTDVSADGKYGYSKMGDRGCTISLTLQQTNPLNGKIAAQFAIQDKIGAAFPVSPFSILDETGKSIHFLIPEAVLTEVASNEFSDAMGEKTWVWVGSSYLMTENLEEVAGALGDYIPSDTSTATV